MCSVSSAQLYSAQYATRGRSQLLGKFHVHDCFMNVRVLHANVADPGGATYVVHTARMRYARCTPHKCNLWGVHRTNETHSVHTVQTVQGRNLCGAHHTNEICAVHTAQIVSAGQRRICKSSFAWYTPDRLHMAVPRQGTIVVIYVVLTAQMELRARWASSPSPQLRCHLCGAHHADRMSA